MQQYRPAYKALRIQFSAALQLLTTTQLIKQITAREGGPAIQGEVQRARAGEFTANQIPTLGQ